MKKNHEIIEQFAEFGARQALSLRDGSYYEGYILETFDEYFEFGLGGPLAPEEPAIIRYDELDFNALSFYDSVDECYKDADWDGLHQTWKIKKTR